MKTYQGKICNRGAGPQIILVFDEGKSYSLKHIERHSPDGFNWGYGGSGPADTALSILTDCLGKDVAEAFYQDFKWKFVSGWGDCFEITEDEIKAWIQRAEDQFKKFVNKREKDK